MSRLHLLILWILAIVAGLLFFNSKKAPEDASSETALDTGSSLFSNDLVETIDGFKIETSENSVSLKKADGNWVVSEKQDFPANLNTVTRVIEALRETKVAQGVVASNEYYDRFNLDPEAEDEDERPEVITLMSGDKESGKIYLGKTRKSTGGGGGTAGRFVRLADDESGVYIVQESFAFLGADPDNWIEKVLTPLEEGSIKMEVSAPNDENFKPWVVSRKTVMDDFLIEGLGEKEETKTNETSTLKNNFSRTTFIELLTEEDAKARADEKGRREIKATDSAGSSFLITVTPEKKEEKAEEEKEDKDNPTPTPAVNYILTIKVLNGPTKPEPPAEDADVQEKAVYQQRVANLADLSASVNRMRKTYEGRYFLVNKASIGSITKNRGEFIKPKVEKKKPVSVTTDPIPVPTPGSGGGNTNPLSPGTPPPGIARPKETNPKKPRIEAVTPPIQVPPVKETPKPKEVPTSKVPESRQDPPPTPGSQPAPPEPKKPETKAPEKPAEATKPDPVEPKVKPEETKTGEDKAPG